MKKLFTLLFMFLSVSLAWTVEAEEDETTSENFLVATVDGTDVTYPIDSPADFESQNYKTSYNNAGDYSFTSNGVSVSVARANVKSVKLEIPLTRACTDNGTYFCGCLFCNCTNLTEANITFSASDECTTVGNYFCSYMFYNCSSLASLSDSFNLPQDLTSVGDNFCYYMFQDCKVLVSLPDSFNIPQGITSVGGNFCRSMFAGCKGLVSLPDSFNIPQGITSVGTYFCAYMFYDCSVLVSLPDSFNLPQYITSVGTYFCYYMFGNCSVLVSLPDSFNIPQGITSVGTYFCAYMFYDCSVLVSLPDSFNLPQEITTTSPSNFCSSMFYYCSNLSDGTFVELTFPFEATNAFKSTSFSQTTASANSIYYIRGNSERFVSYYGQDGKFIGRQSVQNGSIIEEFAVSTDELTIDEGDAFRGWVHDLETGQKATVDDIITVDIALYALVTAVEKADGNSEYTYDLTQQFYEEDHECFAYDEDNNIVLTVGPKAYVVVETEGGSNLSLSVGNESLVSFSSNENTYAYYYGADAEATKINISGTDISKITIYNVASLAFTSDGLIYTIAGGKSVEISGVENNAKSLKILAEVELDDITFTVTGIASDAFSGLDELTLTVTSYIPFEDTPEFSERFKGILICEDENINAKYLEAGWDAYFAMVGGTFSVEGLTYQITSIGDNNTVEIIGTTTNEITIVKSVEYNNLTFTVTQIADYAFDEQTNLTVTVNFESPDAITLGAIANGNVGTLSVPESYEWAFYNSAWATYFTIGGNISFTVEDFTYTIIEQGAFDVELTKYSGNDTSIEISESVIYDSKECTVKSIADNAFDEQTDLTVTVDFESPNAISLGTIATENIGTLTVPSGYEWAFYNSDWSNYFTIDGDISFTVDGFTYTLTSYGETNVTVSAYNGEGGDMTIEPTVVADNGETYTIVSINEGVFTTATLSSVTVKWEDPKTVSPVGAFTEGSSVTLIVPDGLEVSYHDSDWADYFTINNYIEGTKFSADNLTFEITDQYNNEVTIVAFECAESVIIPVSITYNDVVYAITAVADNVFTCDVLREVTMEASEPPFEVSAFTGIPDGVVLKVGNNQEAYASWHGTFIIYGYVKAGDQFSDDVFTYTVLSDTKTVQITALQSTAGTTFGIPTSVTYNGLDFTVTSIADGVFTGKTGLTVSVIFTDPSTISLGAIANGNVGKLSVPEGSERNFENSSWSTYFTIAGFVEGTQFTENGITYEITDQYTYEVKIVGFYCSESVVIPESAVGYTITAVDDDVFNCSDLISVTMEANTPPFSGSTFANIGENAVLYVDNISAYTTSSDNWHKYFTIYGYLEAGDTFSDDVFSYKVLNGAETVEITGIVTTGLSFTINTEVEYNGLTLTIASVDGSIFNGKSDLDVIANFKDPEAPKIDNYNGSQVGTLEVPDGYLYIFTDTNWEKYFVIEGTYLLKDGVQYYFQKDGTADVVGIDTSEPIIFTDRVEGFAIETIEEEIFEDYRDLEVEITVVNPFSIALEERVDKSFKYGEITVPDGCNSLYVGTVWEDYFNIYGETYFTDGSGVYYIFHIEVIEVDEDGFEVVSLNKALKATTTEYRITLEVAYVDPEVTEVTVPRTIDLGDDNSSNTSYEITAMNADALKDCKDLVTINLEAAIPAEDINALNYVPDAVTIVVDEDLGEDYCESIVKVAEQLNIGVEIKSSSTGIRKIVFTKSDEKIVEIERYNLLGQRISAPQRGINIVKYSDGTVEKVLVK